MSSTLRIQASVFPLPCDYPIKILNHLRRPRLLRRVIGTHPAGDLQRLSAGFFLRLADEAVACVNTPRCVIRVIGINSVRVFSRPPLTERGVAAAVFTLTCHGDKFWLAPLSTTDPIDFVADLSRTDFALFPLCHYSSSLASCQFNSIIAFRIFSGSSPSASSISIFVRSDGSGIG